MIEMVCSGFQSGADIGAIKAAHAAGIRTTGYLPKGFKTEYGPKPEYAALYGAMEHPDESYPPRTAANVELADVTVWFGPGDSSGYWCTRKAAERLGKPFWEVAKDQTSIQLPKDLVMFLKRDGVKSINCAGSRGSKAPDLEARVERFLAAVFRLMQKEGQQDAVSAGADNDRFVDRPVGAHGGRR